MSCSKVISQFEVLSSDDLGRRRRWSDEEKIRIVEESLRGHRQGSATARRYGLSRSLLTIWRRQYRRGELRPFGSVSFTPVTLAPETPAPADALPSSQDTQVEIVLPNGRRLIVSVGVEPEMLARLLSVVDRP